MAKKMPCKMYQSHIVYATKKKCRWKRAGNWWVKKSWSINIGVTLHIGGTRVKFSSTTTKTAKRRFGRTSGIVMHLNKHNRLRLCPCCHSRKPYWLAGAPVQRMVDLGVHVTPSQWISLLAGKKKWLPTPCTILLSSLGDFSALFFTKVWHAPL